LNRGFDGRELGFNQMVRVAAAAEKQGWCSLHGRTAPWNADKGTVR